MFVGIWVYRLYLFKFCGISGITSSIPPNLLKNCRQFFEAFASFALYTNPEGPGEAFNGLWYW